MQIRVATAADAAAIARVHVASWQAAYRGQIPDAILDSLDVEQRAVRWLDILAQPNGIIFVADAQNGIIGFCNLISSRDPEVNTKTVAEIAAIYLQPNCRRLGFGRALLERALHEASQRRFATITVWVLKTNLPATRFYESLGFVADGATRTEQIKGFTLNELRLALEL